MVRGKLGQRVKKRGHMVNANDTIQMQRSSLLQIERFEEILLLTDIDDIILA